MKKLKPNSTKPKKSTLITTDDPLLDELLIDFLIDSAIESLQREQKSNTLE